MARPRRPERNRANRSFGQLRRFHHGINSNKVFGTHNQMTDAAYAEAARYCIRGNAVVDTDCGFTGLYTRAVPSHAIELAAVYLDHNVAEVFARAPDAAASPQQKQDLAAFIHLCGAGPASAFVHRGFQMMAGERCGDHVVAAYLAKVNAMKRQFLRLAANGRN